MKRYNPSEIEPKWRDIWDEQQVYKADLASDKPKYYAMSMFNYPSGAGIHIGHAMNYTLSDVMARYKRQAGYESFHPVGWDSFGLPAENFAIKTGISPQESIATIIPDYHAQYKAMGWSNDWSREIATSDPRYYKWTQWIFAQVYKAGLAYQDARQQWWCTKCQTVLSNEQVIDGKCWRHDGADDPLVEKKEVKQWFFKITDYADKMLEATDALDWTESVKLAQKNWIGKSQGAEIDFAIDIDANYVLLHGFTANSKSDFHPWLKEQLEATGARVYSPDLPDTDSPNADTQAAFVLDNYEFNEKTVIIGHSYGSVVALKILEKLTTPIARLVTVAGFAQPGFSDHERNFESTTNWQFDFEKIYNTVQSVDVLRVMNDSAVPSERADYLAEKLSATVQDFTAEANHACGATEPFILKSLKGEITVFTTRPDTLFGATFLVIAPEHDMVASLSTTDTKETVDEYVKQALKKTELERQSDNKDKTGVFTGSYAINPATGEKVPIWVADYVLDGYGTGAIMAVPAHDERDFAFAEKFKLPIVEVIEKPSHDDSEVTYTGEGVLINSGMFDGAVTSDAREEIVAWLEQQNVGKSKTVFKIRDWSVSRQRYWGAPIPIIHCDKCGIQLVPDDQLPVELPVLDDFAPSGDGRGALARATEWLNVKCPGCGGSAERETDTLDTYMCSSWYFLRYLDPENAEAAFDKNTINTWMPVDFYNGADHATAHMIYARFITRFLAEQGYLAEPEPFKKFLFNGKVTAQNGEMFSKSKGNGVDPLEIISQGYGADALRTYLMFAAPLDTWVKWDPQGVPATHRFLNRIWNLVQEFVESNDDGANDTIPRIIHPTIKKVTHDLEHQKYNTAIAAMMEATNKLYVEKANHQFAGKDSWQFALESLVSLVAPFAPHAADEMWQQLGKSTTVQRDSWPEWDEKYLVSETMKIVVQVNGKLRTTLELAKDTDKEAVEAAVLADEKIASILGDKKPTKVIYVPGRLVNIVLV